MDYRRSGGVDVGDVRIGAAVQRMRQREQMTRDRRGIRRLVVEGVCKLLVVPLLSDHVRSLVQAWRKTLGYALGVTKAQKRVVRQILV